MKEEFELVLDSEAVFLGERIINFGGMEQTILALWRPIQGINIEPVGDMGLYLIRFFHIVDLKRMGENLEEIKFLYADFWVQVHDLPSCFVSETLAKSIGNLMDQFVKYDVSSQRNFLNNFMRTRVRLDICVPHMRKKNIRAHSFGYVWIPVCYLCGIIGHSESRY
uniref:DUF4283 domain-containing protein n=1 Tax=Gossypium raimondii TaxID=29730 RepID=A0A0D2SX45_GOSRA|nr:hypothetical protein B456_006G133900 [Gossypium raimondii]